MPLTDKRNQFKDVMKQIERKQENWWEQEICFRSIVLK